MPGPKDRRYSRKLTGSGANVVSDVSGREDVIGSTPNMPDVKKVVE